MQKAHLNNVLVLTMKPITDSVDMCRRVVGQLRNYVDN